MEEGLFDSTYKMGDGEGLAIIVSLIVLSISVLFFWAWVQRMINDKDYRYKYLRYLRVILLFLFGVFFIIVLSSLLEDSKEGFFSLIIHLIIHPFIIVVVFGIVIITFFDIKYKRVKSQALEKVKKEIEDEERRKNSPEYKAEQERIRKQEKEYKDHLKKYGKKEEGRSQALKIRSHWEFETWMATYEILNRLGEYTDSFVKDQRYYLRLPEYGSLSSKHVWEKIDKECQKIKELTGVQLRTYSDIFDFRKNKVQKYERIVKLKQSVAGKLIDMSLFEMKATSANFPGVYLIVNNITFDFYIGESQNMNFRRKTHLGDLVLNSHHSMLMQNHFLKYGESAFDFYVLEKEKMDNDSVRKYAEARWIKEYNPTYN